MPTDQRYEATTAKFKEQYFKLQLIMKDIEMYMNDVEKQINEFGTLALKFEEFAACSPTRFKEYEDRWQSFVRRMKEMKDVALVDHVSFRNFVNFKCFRKLMRQPSESASNDMSSDRLKLP